MLSVPHMIVVFLVVLVVFGPQKLPELARTLGKLMAEFRKASTDFKGAFEEEMRDLERQARLAEVRKATAEAETAEAKAKGLELPAASNTTSGTETLPEAAADYPAGDGPIVTPGAEAVPLLDPPYCDGENPSPQTKAQR